MRRRRASTRRYQQVDSDVFLAMINVIFVCMGNICRSPAGEAVFRSFVGEQGLADRFNIDSAGTIAVHAGEPADRRMQRAAAIRGYDLLSIARQVTAADLDEFDIVVAMDRDNVAALERLGDGAGNIVMLGHFLPEADVSGEPAPVPDPYYGGERGFDEVIDMLEAACPQLLEHCLTLDTR